MAEWTVAVHGLALALWQQKHQRLTATASMHGGYPLSFVRLLHDENAARNALPWTSETSSLNGRLHTLKSPRVLPLMHKSPIPVGGGRPEAGGVPKQRFASIRTCSRTGEMTGDGDVTRAGHEPGVIRSRSPPRKSLSNLRRGTLSSFVLCWLRTSDHCASFYFKSVWGS